MGGPGPATIPSTVLPPIVRARSAANNHHMVGSSGVGLIVPGPE